MRGEIKFSCQQKIKEILREANFTGAVISLEASEFINIYRNSRWKTFTRVFWISMYSFGESKSLWNRFFDIFFILPRLWFKICFQDLLLIRKGGRTAGTPRSLTHMDIHYRRVAPRVPMLVILWIFNSKSSKVTKIAK